jgi:lysozyme family protein
MTALNFPRCLGLLLQKEGGWSNNPSDPGGATMEGVTQGEYNSWLRQQGLPTVSVRGITPSQLQGIYNYQYWGKIDGDALPPGLDNCIFDEAVNSGVGKSVKDLQTILHRHGAYPGQTDGIIGLLTLEGVSKVPTAQLINEVCALRRSWLHRLLTWRVFGRGWGSRVAAVQKESLAMVGK